ncbi:hypothetical protein [Bowmanella denitrificans]|uniref:hypothetical protein n=1 Tax=Bowmanella denitrificans TaxID=366582 RepID=UPI000C99D9B2|nr:hypothetical protein [Bowmanella denitrificans]
MLNKYSLCLSVSIILVSAVVKADEAAEVEKSFNALLSCIETIQVVMDGNDGVSSQQALLVTVLKKITDSGEIGNDLGIDYDRLYKLVNQQCPIELEKFKALLKVDAN